MIVKAIRTRQDGRTDRSCYLNTDYIIDIYETTSGVIKAYTPDSEYEITKAILKKILKEYNCEE